MHHAQQRFHDRVVRLVLQLHLVVLAVNQKVLEQLLEQLNCELGVIQIGLLSKRLLEIS